MCYVVRRAVLDGGHIQLDLDVRRSESAKSPARCEDISLATVGLFAGVGGIELGLARGGHRPLLLCELEETAAEVLRTRFPSIRLERDVRDLKSLPRETDLVTAGFPCQDLSQAGRTCGINGAKSGLVGELFRLLRRRRVPWLVLENVPFMLQLGRGRALDVVMSELERLGYRWAYRVVDTRAFGLPQRRRRVIIVASLDSDPRTVIFADDAGEPKALQPQGRACGFYWTEGLRGLGWAVDAVPTLKGGSTVGVPSPPAILMPDGRVVTPDIRDAERMQGFRVNWTRPATRVGKPSLRWKLVGNAVSVPVAKWIGSRLARPGAFELGGVRPVPEGRSWPVAAWNVGRGRFTADVSEWPKHYRRKSLAGFLRFEPAPLSERATAGFLERAGRAKLRFPDGFLTALREHLREMRSA